jgi:two-component system chemotaxis response regulator CheY
MSKRVLVVDDSALIRRMICTTLIDSGWEIAGEASDGQQAVEMFKAIRPDVITLDIIMPGCSGLTALKEIMKLDPDAKVVVVSALNQTKWISEAIRNGAYDFIAKPFMPEQLQETMQVFAKSGTAA